MNQQSHTTVVVTQLRLTHYRVAFFEALQRELEAHCIRLILLHGQPDPCEIDKRDQGKLGWAIQVANRYWRIGKKYLAWQPLPPELNSAELIVITQENRILSNYLHILRRRFNGPKLAFWGHGANLQSRDRGGIKERFKRWTTNRVDWWFAYTDMSGDLVTEAGFPSSRITVLNNAVDTTELRLQRSSIKSEETVALREFHGINEAPVGVFVGSLYADKRLDFLIEATIAIRVFLPGFQLIIVGDGPERDKVKGWLELYPWVYWVGAQFGRQKVLYMSVAQVMLNPGLVGLGILDSFVCGVPMLTTDCGIHSPEISYLVDGENGVITANNLKDYVSAAVRILRDSEKLQLLRNGCAASAAEYTVENMAKNFAAGVVQCLHMNTKIKSEVNAT